MGQIIANSIPANELLPSTLRRGRIQQDFQNAALSRLCESVDPVPQSELIADKIVDLDLIGCKKLYRGCYPAASGSDDGYLVDDDPCPFPLRGTVERGFENDDS